MTPEEMEALVIQDFPFLAGHCTVVPHDAGSAEVIIANEGKELTYTVKMAIQEHIEETFLAPRERIQLIKQLEQVHPATVEDHNERLASVTAGIGDSGGLHYHYCLFDAPLDELKEAVEVLHA